MWFADDPGNPAKASTQIEPAIAFHGTQAEPAVNANALQANASPSGMQVLSLAQCITHPVKCLFPSRAKRLLRFIKSGGLNSLLITKWANGK